MPDYSAPALRRLLDQLAEYGHYHVTRDGKPIDKLSWTAMAHAVGPHMKTRRSRKPGGVGLQQNLSQWASPNRQVNTKPPQLDDFLGAYARLHGLDDVALIHEHRIVEAGRARSMSPGDASAELLAELRRQSALFEQMRRDLLAQMQHEIAQLSERMATMREMDRQNVADDIARLMNLMESTRLSLDRQRGDKLLHGSSQHRRLGEILVAGGATTKDDVAAALARTATSGERVGEALVAMGKTSPFQVLRALVVQTADDAQDNGHDKVA